MEEFVGEGTQPGGEGEEMVIIFILRSRYTEEGMSSEKLKDKAAETPYIKGLVNSSSKNQLGSPKTERSDRLFRRIRNKICYSESIDVSLGGTQSADKFG